MPRQQPTSTTPRNTVTRLTNRDGSIENHHSTIEDIQLRNFDAEEPHHVTVTITNADDIVTHEKQYFLPPATTIAHSPRLDPGHYSVTAAMDHDRYATQTCHIENPTGYIAIEMGNGVISVTPIQ